MASNMFFIGSRSKGEKRKRVVLTLTQKIDICRRLEKGENRNVLMKEFNVGSSTIYDIKAQKEQLLKFVSSSETSKAVEKRRTLHKPKLEQLDSLLYEWFSLKRSEGAPISGPMLTEKAKDFYKQMDLTEPCAFSAGWLSCFKLRHGIRKLDVPAEIKSADHEAAEKYCVFFNKLVAEHDLSPDQIYNADKTGLFWRCLPNSALAGAGESSAAGFKQNKDRITVLTCANAGGTHKVKLLVVGKCNRPRAFKGITHLPVVYKAQSNAWMNKGIFYDWFHHVFVPSVKEHFRKIGKPQESKAILLLDHCQAHPPECELVSGNIFTIFLPANVTSLIQPMGQGIIQNMKCYYRRDFLRKLINHEGTIQNFQSLYNIKDAVFNVACAWNSVKSKTLRNAWRNLWPSVMFAEGSSDEGDLEGFNVKRRKNTIAQILEVVKDAPSTDPVNKLEGSEIEEWVEADKEVEHVFNDAEIIKCVVNPEKSKVTEKDSEEEDFSEEKKISWASAASHIDNFIKFAERQSCYSAQEVMQLHIIHSDFMQKKQAASRQADIRDFFKKASRACHKASTESVPSPSPSTSAVDVDGSEALKDPQVPLGSSKRQ
ncbi:jerky protein homolog [Alligator sinensis]|uniref:Jerky protein homolog n=1 Tax=Alligator sinensis TaxID=38654 RepID=A0A3Q0FS93_ALLSI|nr:jerky protein homolog [Alligator sinensis]